MAAPKSYKGWPMPNWWNEEGHKLFTELELEESDVVMVSQVKAGTTWVNKILHCLLRMDDQGDMEDHPNDYGKTGQVYPEWLPARKPEDPEWAGVGPGGLLGKVDFADLVGMPRPRLFSTHCGAEELLPASLLSRGRLVYVLRNPKDMLNSLHYFRGEPKDGWKGNEHGPGSLDRCLLGLNAYGSVFDHMLSMWPLIEGPLAGRALPVYYEDLKADVASGVRAMAAFLGVGLSDAKLEAIVKITSFESMSSGSVGKMSGILMRKGVCCDWKNAPLTKEDWDRIDQAFEEKVGLCSLAHPLRPWMDLERTVELRVSTDEPLESHISRARQLLKPEQGHLGETTPEKDEGRPRKIGRGDGPPEQDEEEEDGRVSRLVVSGRGDAAALASEVAAALEKDGAAKIGNKQTIQLKDGSLEGVPLFAVELKV